MGGFSSRGTHGMTSEEDWCDGIEDDESSKESGENFFEFLNKKSSKTLRKELFEVTDDTGYILCDKHYIPEEILSIILSYVEPKNLVFDCRRVCKSWCNIIDTQVWRLKFQRINYIVPKVQELPWFACYWIFTKKTLNRNLVKNGCGGNNFKHWIIIRNGGDRWKIEKPPVGCDNLPEDADEEVLKNNSCFVTSYGECSKEQIIDLAAEGATPEFMDIIQPNITVSEWCSGRFDCLAVHKLTVVFLDEHKFPLRNGNKAVASNHFFEKATGVGAADGTAWHKITHVFDNYGPGVRYIKFSHYGKDRQFWKGHYGSKMTGASVVLTLPKNFVETS